MPPYIIYNDSVAQTIEICAPVAGIDEVLIERVVPKNESGQLVPYIITDSFPVKYTDSYSLDSISLELTQVRDKLHDLKKQEWRQKRAPLLTKYDVAFMRALEVGDQAEINRIKDIKQQLRDVTAENIDQLTNAELEDYTPAILTTA